MPNIASVLKAEISRVARKEVRTEIEALKKASAQQRSAIAALRREVDALRKELRLVARRGAKAEASRTALAADDATRQPQRRFSPTRLAAHRVRTGLSAASYGRLCGIGGQTIYNWEQGKSRPSPAQIDQLAVLKTLGRVELAAKLESAGS